MRMLMKVQFPHKPFNAAVKDGSIGKKVQSILDALKPEAVYFTEINGQRGAIMIVDLETPSSVPKLAEPWFLGFEANVGFHIVMGPDDLKAAGLEELGKKWS